MIVKTDPQIIGLSFIITVNIQVSAAITEIKWRWKYVHVQYKKYLSSQLNSMTLKNISAFSRWGPEHFRLCYQSRSSAASTGTSCVLQLENVQLCDLWFFISHLSLAFISDNWCFLPLVTCLLALFSFTKSAIPGTFCKLYHSLLTNRAIYSSFFFTIYMNMWTQTIFQILFSIFFF